MTLTLQRGNLPSDTTSPAAASDPASAGGRQGDGRRHIPIVFDDERDTIVAHRDPTLESVLHVMDRDWHGIRSATAALPGAKLAISHKNHLKPEETRRVFRKIREHGYRAICFQGYSSTVDRLVEELRREFGAGLRLHVVTHVTTSQFEHHFEIEMLERIRQRLTAGFLTRVGSVKPRFHHFLPGIWPRCILNIPPDLSRLILALPSREAGTVFVPLENTWRKNLYSQVIAAHGSEKVRRLCLVAWPHDLERLMILDKAQLVGFQSLPGLLAHMRLAQVVANVSFSECQPMTQLEALAVGTPTLVGPLRLPEFSAHPLSALCEVREFDDPALLRQRFELILDEWTRDPAALSEMISDFLRLRTAAGLARYREFLEL